MNKKKPANYRKKLNSQSDEVPRGTVHGCLQEIILNGKIILMLIYFAVAEEELSGEPWVFFTM